MARPKLDGEGGEVVKKVRLTRAQAKRLQKLAKQIGVTESDVLRRGVELVEKNARREAALQKLVEWAEKDAHYIDTKDWQARGFK